ncbi:MAG: hypothetical protein RR502_07000 [Oscillospiraceae bacterium]
MGSLRWEITHCERFVRWDGHPTANTVKLYQSHCARYADWCRATFGARHYNDCRVHIQDYADYLVAAGKTAATVHTYLAGVCYAYDVPMSNYNKPKRRTIDITRSRGKKAVDARGDAQPETSPWLYAFADAVGVRRHEYLRLKGEDLVRDESGCLCVLVRKGKGGKRQMQRILPADEAFVAAYFAGVDKNEYIFSKNEMTNKIDLHHVRAQVAQRAYGYYLGRLSTEPDYRLQLQSEIKARWQRENGRQWNQHEVEGTYYIRGENRKFAIGKGLPVSYDRLAVMATSVFHLSHWRNDVTICNYFLAV